MWVVRAWRSEDFVLSGKVVPPPLLMANGIWPVR